MKKLFLDTAGEYFNVAIIENNKVEFFESRKNNNDLIGEGLIFLFSFLNKRKISLKDIDGYYFTIGPGFFTGTKIALNIINSFNLVFPRFDFNYITNYDLLHNENKRYVLLKLSKQKYYLHDFAKRGKKNRGKIIDILETKEDFNIVNGYQEFNKKILEDKICKKKFIKINNLAKVDLLYVNNFIN
ncbi:MAG: hypothetical protein HPPSJP_0520 [Candidatus Hepatoplasma scabrum]|nr:MAG: hypothetical protein HPPSJP_0520 [Candidatus Hepatoplasma sp.]